ncbi:hypothetical protein HXX76_014056 [Chlamydomonas incerta]|uniref:Uncharacterized protein n=1 Tax=Chlamydomonas incerta TaxID=51695 RepID=A0A835SCS6_CHLIN|nr:hypothetical protein HXX76_014056 [Chlamydomonas incerta]|eukprot:KAG2424898.1 hypothetical protein HXX76_014056 [Chlamydomonas incerta]
MSTEGSEKKQRLSKILYIVSLFMLVVIVGVLAAVSAWNTKDAGFVRCLNERLVMEEAQSVVYGFDGEDSDSQLGLCALFMVQMHSPHIALGSSALYRRLAECKRLFRAATLRRQAESGDGPTLAFASKSVLLLEGCSGLKEVAAVRAEAPPSAILLIRGLSQAELVDNAAGLAAQLDGCVFELEVVTSSETEFRLLVMYLRSTGLAVVIRALALAASAGQGQGEQGADRAGPAYSGGSAVDDRAAAAAVTTIPVKQFDMSLLKMNTVIVAIGRRNSGKSTLIKDILYHQRKLPAGCVISGSEEVNSFYSGFVPGILIKNEFRSEHLENLFKRQRKVMQRVEEGDRSVSPDSFLVMDDCLFDNKWINDVQMRRVFLNGRHYKITYLLSLQFPLGITPFLRTQIDYVFILRDQSLNNRKRIYVNYAGIIPTFELFCKMLDRLTSDYGCMVIDNTNPAATSYLDCVRWYRANTELPAFRMCDDALWKLNSEHLQRKKERERELDQEAAAEPGMDALQSMKNKLAQLVTEKARLAELQAGESSDWDYDRIVTLRDSIAGLKLEVRQLRKAHDELSYLSDTGEILLSYFETYENASSAPCTAASAAPAPRAAAYSAAGGGGGGCSGGAGSMADAGGGHGASGATGGTGSSKILSFFGKAAKVASEPKQEGRITAGGPTGLPPAAAAAASTAGGSAHEAHAASGAPAMHSNRGSMYEKYMQAVDRNYLRQFPEDTDRCPFCGCKEKQLVSHEGLEYCTSCHHTQKLLMEADKPSYKEPPNEVTYYSYKRSNHYNEWINQIQGKEYTEIPNDIIDAILVELKKQKITNMASLTPKKVREILRKLKINRYYEHTSFIMYKLNGIPPPRLGEETEEKLRQMFDAIQVPYLRHGPAGRKNFLSYSYVLHKLLQIMGKNEFLMYFPLLKSRDKCYQSDIVWKKICADLGAFCQAAIGGVSGQVEPLIGWISKAKVEASLLLARDITEQLRAGVAVSDLYNQTQTWWKHRISSAVPGTDRPKGALWNQVLNYAATEFETMVCNNAWVPLFPRLGRLCKTWLSHLCPSLKKLVKAVRDHAEEQLPWDFDFWLPELQQFVREEVERLQHVPGQLQQMEERAEELWSRLSSSVPKKAYHVLEEIRCASPAGEQHSGKPEWHREVQRFVVEVRRQLRARADQALFDDHGAKQMSFPEVLRFNFWMQQQFIELRTKRMKLMPTSVQHLMEMEKENNRFQSHAAKQAPAAAELAQEEASDDEEDAASASSVGPSTSAGSGPSSRKPAINRRDPKKMLPRTIKRKECASVEEFKAKQLERQAKVERIKKLPEFTDREQQYAALKKQEDTVMELLFDKRVLSLRSGSGLLFDFSLVTDGVAASLQYQRPKSASLNSSTDRARGRAKVLKKPKAKGAGKKGAAGQRKKSAPQPGADAPTTEEEWDRHLDCFDEASNLLTLGADPGRRFLVTVGLVTAYALSADGKRLECKDKQRRYTWSLSRAQYRHESGVRRQDLLKAQRYSALQQFFADLCQPETALRTDDPNTIQAYMQAVAPRRAEWWSLALQKVESEAAFARYRGKRSVLDRFWARVRRDVARLLPRGDAQPRVELAYGSCGVTMKSGGRGEVSVPVAGTYKACVRAFGGANVRASPLKKTSVQVTTEFRSTMVSWETGMVKRLVYRVVEPKATAAPDPSQQRPVATARQREALCEQLRQLRQQRHPSSRLSAAARLRAASAAAPGVEQEGALPGCDGARPRFQRCSVTSALHFSVRVARPGAKQPPVVINPTHLAAQRRFKELEEHRENSRRGGAAARDGDEWQGEGGHEGVERYSEVRGLRFDPGTRMFRLRDADAATTIARFRIMQRQGKELPKPFRPKTELKYGPE